MHKKVIDRDWGFAVAEISNNRFDFLPRLTISALPYMLEVNVGFLCFRAWLTIFSDQMQDFNRRNAENA